MPLFLGLLCLLGTIWILAVYSSTDECHWDFDVDCIESVDRFCIESVNRFCIESADHFW